VRSFVVSKLAVPWCADTGAERARTPSTARHAPKIVAFTTDLQVRWPIR
jgi:hypothetical protein